MSAESKEQPKQETTAPEDSPEELRRKHERAMNKVSLEEQEEARKANAERAKMA